MYLPPFPTIPKFPIEEIIQEKVNSLKSKNEKTKYNFKP